MTNSNFVTLKKGSKGAAVTRLQQRLKTLGYYSASIDGDFGAKTEAAVIAFQKNNAVAVDGVVGMETESAIQRGIWVSQRPILKQGSKGEEVKRLQSLLQKTEEISPQLEKPIKLDIGAIDGDFGAKTKAAVVKYQNYEKITADGIVGRKTWDNLSGILTFDYSPEQIVLNNVFGLV
ncbi:peptidoglycan-binding protein [Plectonema cf. radiosum LEGE 06105]|uniref:Peptidoglycan-binding protein n=1 Tax=Plectonema cf. radiosum LEGE 06105 TaxID=945769 RepID=A0A8J7F7E0_9CYAN|nr:peptidoglycan-binding protein [Plectonema radiosum]MBE9213384.1 peptidoglycan-binding protein [Plectonema cf. radiosum LEGE 06105]